MMSLVLCVTSGAMRCLEMRQKLVCGSLSTHSVSSASETLRGRACQEQIVCCSGLLSDSDPWKDSKEENMGLHMQFGPGSSRFL